MIAAYFDIETAPQPASKIAHLIPDIAAPSNYKDAEKILSYINAAKSKWLEEAALSAITGTVLCVGVLRPANGKHIFELVEGEEETILETIWGMYSTGEFEGVPWVGFNCKGFDLPFLIRRSWHLRVPVHGKLFIGRYFSNRIVDLMDIFGCFQNRERDSLDRISKFLGVGEKNGSGADFAKVWASDKPKAIEYLKNDLALIKGAADVMGVESFFHGKEDAKPIVKSGVRVGREPMAITV
jgi:hypothetical protein